MVGKLLDYPLLPVNMLVGGGFCVFGYTVVYGGFGWFPVTNAAELHGRFRPLKREKDPHPARGEGQPKNRSLARQVWAYRRRFPGGGVATCGCGSRQ